MHRSIIRYFILLFAAGLLFSFTDNLIAQPPPPPPPIVPPPPPPDPLISPSESAQFDSPLGRSIVYTKHNLSTSGPGTVKSISERRICIFCHTPHKARAGISYLWNRSELVNNYITYQSSTLYANVNQPSGASKLCLSCHDGTIALGALISEVMEIPFAGGIRFIPEGSAKIGTDLSDDHPVSFVYDNSLAANVGEMAFPATLPAEIKLDVNQQMQCTACHDPHINLYGRFLVLTNKFSNLCISCHQMDGWAVASHAKSSATWDGFVADPWPHTNFNTVSENGCENCHVQHSAGGHERLLQYNFEEDNCLVCHSGRVASSDIESELTKQYNHPVQDYVGIHDPNENFTTTVQNHVECSDCHNAHVANSSVSPGAPRISGINNGIIGINSAGQQILSAENLYEICYKCHADNNVISALYIDRVIQQLNTRLEFNPSNPSYHPVEFQGANTNVPSLLPPYTTSTMIFCTDCHSSDNSSGPQGPHGSNFRFLLEKNYTTQDFTIESSYNYALCYKCHDRNSILNNASFKKHNEHIRDNNTPCSACHDPHGISSTQGNSTNNTHLINFDLSIVQSDSQGRLRFEDTGVFSGRCYLNCHGKEHSPESY